MRIETLEQRALLNVAPKVIDHSYPTAEDTLLSEDAPGLFQGATDPDVADVPTALVVSQPSNGVVSVNSATGAFTYQPFQDYYGTDIFTYKVNDGQADSNVAKVTLTITAVSDPPVATDDSYSTNEHLPRPVLARGVLLNDIDPDNISGDKSIGLTAKLETQPSHGTLNYFQSDGSFQFQTS